MRLTVWVPSEILLDEEVVRIRAQADNGSFGLLPRHVDFTTALVPSVLIFQRPEGQTEYLAIDHGILVKCGPQVRISTRNAVRGASLADLKARVHKQFQEREELEKKARIMEAKLETDLVRHLMEAERNV